MKAISLKRINGKMFEKLVYFWTKLTLPLYILLWIHWKKPQIDIVRKYANGSPKWSQEFESDEIIIDYAGS